MICLSHYFCWLSILPMGKSIFEIFMWLLCLLLRQSLQELPRAGTEPNGARLHKTEGWVTFLYKVCVDFQLAFTKPIQRREHGKNSPVLKVQDTTLVREKTYQKLYKNLYPLKGQIRSILFKPIMWKAVPETFLSSTQLKKPNYPVLTARARTDCFVVKSTFLLENSWKKMLLQSNHPADRRACTQGILLVVYLRKTSSAGCNTGKHNHADWATK